MFAKKPLAPVEHLNAYARRAHWPMTCDDGLVFDSARLGELAGVWERARGANALPARADLSPRLLARHLCEIGFADCLREPGQPRRFRFGFYGSGLVHYTGNFTGKLLEEIVPAHFLLNWYTTYDTALAVTRPLRLVSQFRALNLDHMIAETLLAPYADASGQASGVLFSAVYSAYVG